MSPALIEDVAKLHGLDPKLIEAIVFTESNGDNWATRYESHWRYFHKTVEHARRLRITEMTERKLQMFSWGCMQVMGSVARELGFLGHLQEMSSNPKLALEMGCKHFKNFLKKYHNAPDAIASYNAGSPRKIDNGMYRNQAYVSKVLTKWDELRRF